MAEAVAVPEHKLSESPNTRSIEIFDWFITASTNPISNAVELDALQASLGIPLPEMTFGSNYLELEHRKSGWKYRFDAEHCLKGVRNGELQPGDGGVKVGQHTRTSPTSAHPMPKTVATKPYDWTYTTTYSGHCLSQDTDPWDVADIEDPAKAIPIAELTRPDPILFYAEIPLFEDELHDNGTASSLIKIASKPLAPSPSFMARGRGRPRLYHSPEEQQMANRAKSNRSYEKRRLLVNTRRTVRYRHEKERKRGEAGAAAADDAPLLDPTTVPEWMAHLKGVNERFKKVKNGTVCNYIENLCQEYLTGTVGSCDSFEAALLELGSLDLSVERCHAAVLRLDGVGPDLRAVSYVQRAVQRAIIGVEDVLCHAMRGHWELGKAYQLRHLVYQTYVD
ncbi:hypothetical protein ONZ45_g10662 [Pleurotus djamor]|nr:hypothetical protein ONZ45_g10662 [Pleurotus djamor]